MKMVQSRFRIRSLLVVVVLFSIAIRMREMLMLPGGVGEDKSFVQDDPRYWTQSSDAFRNRTSKPERVKSLFDNISSQPRPKAISVGSSPMMTTPKEAPVSSPHASTGDSSRTKAVAMLEEVIHMLFSSSQSANNYIAKFPTINFSFYVYDNLPESYQWKAISDCVEKRYRPKHMDALEFQNLYCDFAAANVCNARNVTSENQYSTRRANRNMDTVVSKLFSEYNGPLRTQNPAEATIFIVPLAANGLFECLGSRKAAQKKTSLQFLRQEVFEPYLKFYNNHTKSKHWFFQTTQGTMHNLAHESLLATVNTPGGRTLIVPYVNSNAEYQLPVLEHLLNNPDAFERFFANKNISMAAVMSSNIKGNPTMREMFFNSSQTLFGNDIGGLPLKLFHVQGRRRMPDEQETMRLYRQSIFCPSLRGDSPNQKRFFDAILSGCIPVVMAHYYATGSPPLSKNETSYFAPNVPLAHYLPYAKGSFFGEPEMGIAYSEIVVEINAKTCGLACVKPALEALMRDPVQLRQKQRALIKYSRILSYGLAENAWQHADTMTAMLVHARHEIETRRKESNKENKL